MSRIVGIDLGTTHSLVAAVDAGIPLILPGADGQRLTPSIVHYGPGGPVVGEKARHLRLIDPASTLSSVKRLIGRRGADLSPEEMGMAYAVRSEGAGPVRLAVAGRSLLPEEVSAEVLRQLKGDAERFFGEPISRAVITVPAYFNDAQRQATKRAGELAGLVVERILNEPTAAALAHGLHRLRDRAKIAVYDLGGGTFDLSILELREGVFQVLATQGNTRLGGDDLDRRIVEHLARAIQEAGGPDPATDLKLLARLHEEAEQAKIRLSQVEETAVTLPFLTPGFSFSCQLTRAKLEELTRDLILRTREHCLRALADAKIEAKDLEQVILVGGQTRMPLVRDLVSDWFGCVEFEPVAGGLRLGTDYHPPAGPMLNTTVNPDEAVALGAAIQAEILAGGFKDILLLDVTPLSLGLETFGGLMNVIIPRNSTIPIKAGEMFTTAVDGQASMLIHVLQGERERAADNWSLGRFTLDFARAPRGAARVGVQFEIDANGILQVLARDTVTGAQKIVEMKSAVDVSDAEVQRMVEESVEHAFDDLAARRWVEAQLKARETAAATRHGLAQTQGELSPGQLEAIERALAAIEAILARENPDTHTGDLSALKAAHASLDAATQPLAERLMDRAMEAMLKKRGLI